MSKNPREEAICACVGPRFRKVSLSVTHVTCSFILARIMHKFSTASPQSSVLTVLRSFGLLSVPYSTLAGASVARLVRPAPSALRDENLCIIRARGLILTAGTGLI